MSVYAGYIIQAADRWFVAPRPPNAIGGYVQQPDNAWLFSTPELAGAEARQGETVLPYEPYPRYDPPPRVYPFRVYYAKPCAHCGATFQPTGPRSLYCLTHRGPHRARKP